MRKNSLFIIFIFILIGALLNSCRRDNKDEDWTDEERFENLKAGFHPTITHYRIDPSVSNTLEGAKGTKIIFEPNSFYYPDGSMVTDDSVYISVTELQKANDFVLQGSSAVTTGEDLLRSGGQLVITAEADGQEVRNSGYAVTFSQKSLEVDLDQPMAIFYGQDTEPVTWEVDEDIDETMPKFDETLGAYAYVFDGLSQFGWINCDYWLSDLAPKTNVRVSSTVSGFYSGNAQVYFIIPGINSASTLYVYDHVNQDFSLPGPMVPVGMEAQFVFFGVQDGINYLYISGLVTVTPDLELSITPEASTVSEIVSALNAL